MNMVADFAQAAFPWIAMGLLLAMFFAGMAAGTRDGRADCMNSEEQK